MNIVIALNRKIPVTTYGGIERVYWCLGKAFVDLGHKVTYLLEQGSWCDFAPVIPLDNSKDFNDQVPPGTDVVHVNFETATEIKFPYIINMHVNVSDFRELDINTVFISGSHAAKYGSDQFVYNGLDWNEYTKPEFSSKRNYFHFLGKAAWRVKNVKGAIKVVRDTPHERLKVIGGSRLNIKMGFRLTLSPRITFAGMVDDKEKNLILNRSKGLVFPVRWDEPFGLAITESLYCGCPVFGTPYGSLPEIVGSEVGYLSANSADLTQAILNASDFDNAKCHQYAADVFSAKKMAEGYLEKYETVISGKTINPVKPRLKVLPEKFLPWY